jgi:hypothetical protein
MTLTLVHFGKCEKSKSDIVILTRQTLDEIAQFLMQAGEEVPPM